MENFHTQLGAEKEKVRTLARLKREMESLTNELHELQRKESAYKKKLDEEQVDVQKLEGFSLLGVFLTLAGKKEERLDEEQQEVLAAQLKWKEAQEAKDDVEMEINHLEQQLREIGDPESTYRQLLIDRQNYMVKVNQEEGEHAVQLIEQVANLKADVKEINEAIDAGNRAKNGLSQALGSLKKAQNWGTFDMFGGGVISTSIKHGHMDTAKEEVHRAQRLLRKFTYELDDIGQTFQADLSISGGLTFMDYFFDGLISDWLVQDKINNSYHEVDKMYQETSSTLTKLERLLQDTKQTAVRLEGEWERLITGMNSI